MKKKQIFAIAGGICAALIIIALILWLNKSCRTKVPEFVFTYAENHPKDYPTTLGGYYFADLVSKKTDGRIQIIVQEDGVLGDEKTVIQQVIYGGIDFARVSLSPLSEVIPELNVLQMPYLYVSSNHMWTVLDGKIGDYFLTSLKEADMIGLSWYDAGARNFYSTSHPIHRVEDMSGIKIRVQESELMVSMVEALGAAAVPLPYDEVYSALEKCTIDGAENNWPSYESSGHSEIAKYYTIDEHTRVPEVQMCSQATWEQLTIKDQKIIMECAHESALFERKLWKERELQSEELVKQNGVTIITLSKEEKLKFFVAMEPVYKEFCANQMELVEKIQSLSP